MDSIIFDVDGTIWDSTESVAASWNKAITDNAYPEFTVDPDGLSKVFGKTMTEIADTLFPALSSDRRTQYIEPGILRCAGSDKFRWTAHKCGLWFFKYHV